MWGFLGIILSLLDDLWSKNTPDNIEATKMYYDRKKELLQMDEWERRMFILVDKQLKEGFTGMNMYRQYFIEWIPHKVVFINRFYPSSKLCSDCGYKNDSLQLSDREWVCPECGVIHDRDINAAKNILEEGKRIIGLSSPEFKRVGEQAVASSMNLERNVRY